MKHFFILLSALLGCTFTYAQNVGINTKTPAASFNVATGNTVIFGTDSTSLENKLMWLPVKGAFRSGWYPGTASDTIGLYSTAIGYSIASGQYATAMCASTASGQFSTAMGFNSIASGKYSTAMNNGNASGNYSTAMGGSTASGGIATAMGWSTASGLYSTAMGQSTASGQYSTSMGYGSIASGGVAIAMGNGTAIGNYSTAMGFSIASGQASTSMGNNTYAKSPYETVIGTYNDTSNTNRLFEIGDGTYGSLNNALTVLNNGKIGVATSTPQAIFTVAAGKTVLFGGDTTSAGNKIIWLPNKGAFRSGWYAGSTYDPIGFYSVTMGNSIASGNFSTAMGRSIASGNQSTAMDSSVASGQFSTAMGVSTASGGASTAMGASTVSGSYSTAMGASTASGGYSTAMGNSNASGFASTAMGQSIAVGGISTAMGNSNASGFASTAMGQSIAVGGNSTSMGYFARAYSNNETAIGIFNDTSNTNRLFEIGDGTSGSLNNALTVLNTGLVGIGTVNPNASLEIDYASSITSPQLLLNQTDASSAYSRLSFQNTLGKSWILAVSRNSSSASDVINFYDEQLGENRFTFYGNGNATFAGTLTQNSDERLKTNIHCIKEVLPEINSINAYTYNWKEANRGQEEQIGFLAQEIEKVYPQLVRTDEKGIKSVAYQNMVPILLQAIKEQQVEFEDQKQQLEEEREQNKSMQSKLNDVTAELAALQKQVETLAALQKTNGSLTAKNK